MYTFSKVLKNLNKCRLTQTLLLIATQITISNSVIAQQSSPTPSQTVQPTITPSPSPTAIVSNEEYSTATFNRTELNKLLAGTTDENRDYSGKQSLILGQLGLRIARRINSQTVLVYPNSNLPSTIELPALSIRPTILGTFAGSEITPPNDPLFKNQWYLDNTAQLFPDENFISRAGLANFDIAALSGWYNQKDSSSVVVAVVDSGIDYNHIDLFENAWSNILDPRGDKNGDGQRDDDRNPNDNAHYTDDHRGWDFSRCDQWDNSAMVTCKIPKSPSNDPIDRHIDGHGTHIAGIISARANNYSGIAGVSWNTKLLPIKVGSREGYIPESELIEALQYVINLRRNHNVNIRVINISATWNTTCSSALRGLLLDADALEILVVTAAGNNYPQGKMISNLNPVSPALCATDNLITVASASHLGQMSSSSNYSSSYVHLAAPGTYLTSTLPNNRYGSYSGTSQAAAVTSGAAALLFAKKPELSARNAKSLILNSARKVNCAISASLCNKTSTSAVLDIGALLSHDQSTSSVWQNPNNKLDTNNDGRVSPIDALIIINLLNDKTYPDGALPVNKINSKPYYDVNGNRYVSPVDALQVINYLNEQSKRSVENVTREMQLETRTIPIVQQTSEILMLKGDLNDDQDVNDSDIAIIMQNLGKVLASNTLQRACDLNLDGVVDHSDLTILYENYGSTLLPKNAGVLK